TELPKLIESYGYDHTILDKDSIEIALSQIDKCDTTETICIIKKDSFSKVELEEEHQLDLSNYTPRSEYLKYLNEQYKDSNILFIGTTGNAAREMYSFMKDTNNFYMAGNMGGALSLGVGASKAGKKVVVCGGDAEFVMHMGGLTTAGRYSDDLDLTYILFDNEANKSTGGQNTYQGHIDYIAIAKASNLSVEEKTITTIEEFSKVIEQQSKGLNFIHVKCGFDEETPRPPIDVVKVSGFNG
ncbi:MAG: thiamine pyrophosphate-dependent enzyme, partial [Campylobacterales bacterium]|nr:thiamine pyrophosphate-dependent enzyme [Campylobacterales bacterium]